MEDMFITPIQPWSRVGDAAASGQTSASSQAQLSIDLLAALRTKALEAYNEIMRLSS